MFAGIADLLFTEVALALEQVFPAADFEQQDFVAVVELTVVALAAEAALALEQVFPAVDFEQQVFVVFAVLTVVPVAALALEQVFVVVVFAAAALAAA